LNKKSLKTMIYKDIIYISVMVLVVATYLIIFYRMNKNFRRAFKETNETYRKLFTEQHEEHKSNLHEMHTLCMKSMNDIINTNLYDSK